MSKHSTILASISQPRFDAFACKMARTKGADLVLSSADYPAQTISVVGVNPVAELRFTENTSPLDIKTFCFDTPGIAMGFVSYTYGMLLRGVNSDKQLDFPLGHLKKYAATIEHDPETQNVTITSADQLLRKEITQALANAPDTSPNTDIPGLPTTPPEASLDGTAYCAGVRETLERILSGYTYQLNLSTKLSWDCPDLDPLQLLIALRKKHPAPFYAWLTSDSHTLLSTSPERFLRVADGHVLSQPIKGTLRFEEYNSQLIEHLTQSPKESAELSMIVDLIRNDISTNCAYGSVQVENHKSVFAVDNLLQMYSDVHGDLKPDRDCLDLFLDAFPGGSVTGCPKKSSMEIIEELEPHSRGMYCGSAVVIRDKKNMDSSILIRTASHNKETGKLNYFAGSGIVVDSDPANEYQETIAKAEKFLNMGTS